MGKFLSSVFFGFCFWGFVIVKVWGHAFDAWRWWWLLLSFVPWVGEALKHLGYL